MSAQRALTPEEFGREAAKIVADSVAAQLRVDPEMIAAVLGLMFVGTWEGVHHFTAPAEGFRGVRFNRTTT